MRFVVLAVLAACGSQPASSGASSGTSSSGSTTPGTPSTTGCAASYAAVPLGRSCAPVDQRCVFPEGDCTCGPEAYCGGRKPPPELLDKLAKPHWHCRARRTDGCPEAEPTGACTDEGLECWYGDCCKVPLTCTAGAWVAGDKSCPP